MTVEESTNNRLLKAHSPWLTLPTIALIAANLIPLLGVIIGGWELRLILLIYWAESAIIGFYHVLRMVRFFSVSGAVISIFFTFHYGLFMLVHCVFILVLTEGGLFGSSGSGPTNPDLDLRATLWSVMKTWPMLVSLAALFVSHGISFVRYAILSRPTDLPDRPAKFMALPYVRIVLMHLALVLGAFPVLALGSPIFLLVILIVGKIVIDVYSHRREHRSDDLNQRAKVD